MLGKGSIPRQGADKCSIILIADAHEFGRRRALPPDHIFDRGLAPATVPETCGIGQASAATCNKGSLCQGVKMFYSSFSLPSPCPVTFESTAQTTEMQVEHAPFLFLYWSSRRHGLAVLGGRGKRDRGLCSTVRKRPGTCLCSTCSLYRHRCRCKSRLASWILAVWVQHAL